MCKEPQLPEFMNEIAKKIPLKWKQLGIQLRLDVTDLDRIEADLLYEPTENRLDGAFMRVFTTWKKLRPSAFAWATLVTVLQSPALNEQTLAQKLNDKFN